MFENCHSINSLNLNNFDTSKVLNMDNMFANCYSLNDLNINNFDTSQATTMSNMFANCSNLTSLNLSSFTTTKADITKMFYNCSNLVYINLKKAKIKTNSNTQEIFRLTNDNLIVCSENDEWGELLSNNNQIINCIKTKKIEFRCYKKLMNIGAYDIICDSCGLNYKIEVNNKSTDINCYYYCPYYHYYDIHSNEMFCLDNCSGIYNKLIQEKNECIDDCKRDYIYKYELKKGYNIICVNKSIFATEQKNQIMSEINKTKLENGNDEEIKEDNIIIALTTTSNQKNNENINKTSINLGESNIN